MRRIYALSLLPSAADVPCEPARRAPPRRGARPLPARRCSALQLHPALARGPSGDGAAQRPRLPSRRRRAPGRGHRAGEPFLEPWVSEWALGYPVWRSYQPLPHLVGAVALRLAAPFASPEAAFAGLHYALLALLPASLYLGARILGLRPAAAGLACVLALLPSASGELGRYGLGYGATTWRGSGLHTQLFALHLLAPFLGIAARALDSGRRRAAAALLLALTALSHIVFGYVAAVSAAVLAVVGEKGERARRLARLASIAVGALPLVLWFGVPLLVAAGEVNHSRWEDAHKWDSHGAPQLVREIASGKLFDSGRAPVLTIALAIGLAATVAAARREALARRLAVLVAVWLLLFFGRATWGHLLLLAGVPRDLHLHRLQAAFELFTVLAAAFGLERLLRGHAAAPGAGARRRRRARGAARARAAGARALPAPADGLGRRIARRVGGGARRPRRRARRGAADPRRAARPRDRGQGGDLGPRFQGGIGAGLRLPGARASRFAELPLPLDVAHLGHHGAARGERRRARRRLRSARGDRSRRASGAGALAAARTARPVRGLRDLARGLLRAGRHRRRLRRPPRRLVRHQLGLARQLAPAPGDRRGARRRGRVAHGSHLRALGAVPAAGRAAAHRSRARRHGEQGGRGLPGAARGGAPLPTPSSSSRSTPDSWRASTGSRRPSGASRPASPRCRSPRASTRSRCATRPGRSSRRSSPSA